MNIKTFESFGNKLEYGDYIVIQIKDWKGIGNLKIMSVHNTPGPIGSKWLDYKVNVIYELLDNELKYVYEFEPKQYEKKFLEENCLYVTKDLQDAKNMIFIIKDTNKYNL